MKKLSLFKVLPIIVAALVGLAIATSCEKEKENGNEQIIAQPAEHDVAFVDFTDSIPCMMMSMDSVTLVNDSATLKHLCDSAAALDFSSQSLVIVSGVSTSGIDTIKTSLTTTDNIQYRLSVDVIQDMTSMPMGWKKYLLIPKTLNINNITLLINYKKH